MLLKTHVLSKVTVFMACNYLCFNYEAFLTGLLKFEDYYSISLMKGSSERKGRIVISRFSNGFLSLNVC